MTSVRKLKIVAGAGDPDSVLARRIDVIQAAHEWYDACRKGDYAEIDIAIHRLEVAVRRYRGALKQRRGTTQ